MVTEYVHTYIAKVMTVNCIVTTSAKRKKVLNFGYAVKFVIGYPMGRTCL